MAKEPFVPPEDRPEVKLDPDKPITELRVRDLTAILGQIVVKKYDIKEPIKEFKDHKPELKEFKEVIKDFKDHKPEFKELKYEKFEFEPPKPIYEPPKQVYEPPKQALEPQFDPSRMIDPVIREGLARVIETVGGLTKKVDDLANQVVELQKKVR